LLTLLSSILPVFFWFLSSRSPLWFLCVFVFSVLFFSVLVPPGILGAALCVVRPVLSFLFFSLLVPPLSGFLFFSPSLLFLIFQFLSSFFSTSSRSLCFPSLFSPFKARECHAVVTIGLVTACRGIVAVKRAP